VEESDAAAAGPGKKDANEPNRARSQSFVSLRANSGEPGSPEPQRRASESPAPASLPAKHSPATHESSDRRLGAVPREPGPDQLPFEGYVDGGAARRSFMSSIGTEALTYLNTESMSSDEREERLALQEQVRRSIRDGRVDLGQRGPIDPTLLFDGGQRANNFLIEGPKNPAHARPNDTRPGRRSRSASPRSGSRRSSGASAWRRNSGRSKSSGDDNTAGQTRKKRHSANHRRRSSGDSSNNRRSSGDSSNNSRRGRRPSGNKSGSRKASDASARGGPVAGSGALKSLGSFAFRRSGSGHSGDGGDGRGHGARDGESRQQAPARASSSAASLLGVLTGSAFAAAVSRRISGRGSSLPRASRASRGRDSARSSLPALPLVRRSVNSVVSARNTCRQSVREAVRVVQREWRVPFAERRALVADYVNSLLRFPIKDERDYLVWTFYGRNFDIINRWRRAIRLWAVAFAVESIMLFIFPLYEVTATLESDYENVFGMTSIWRRWDSYFSGGFAQGRYSDGIYLHRPFDGSEHGSAPWYCLLLDAVFSPGWEGTSRFRMCLLNQRRSQA
jgi:hypothetical protein